MAERAKAKRRTKDNGNGPVPRPRRARSGDNGPPAGLTEDEKRIEINRLNRFYDDWQRDAAVSKQSQGVYNSQRKVARKKGLDIKAYEDARDLDRGDHGATVLHFAHAGEYLKIMKSPLATQLELFQNIAPPFTSSTPGEEAAAPV